MVRRAAAVRRYIEQAIARINRRTTVDVVTPGRRRSSCWARPVRSCRTTFRPVGGEVVAAIALPPVRGTMLMVVTARLGLRLPKRESRPARSKCRRLMHEQPLPVATASGRPPACAMAFSVSLIEACALKVGSSGCSGHKHRSRCRSCRTDCHADLPGRRCRRGAVAGP